MLLAINGLDDVGSVKCNLPYVVNSTVAEQAEETASRSAYTYVTGEIGQGDVFVHLLHLLRPVTLTVDGYFGCEQGSSLGILNTHTLRWSGYPQ